MTRSPNLDLFTIGGWIPLSVELHRELDERSIGPIHGPPVPKALDLRRRLGGHPAGPYRTTTNPKEHLMTSFTMTRDEIYDTREEAKQAIETILAKLDVASDEHVSRSIQESNGRFRPVVLVWRNVPGGHVFRYGFTDERPSVSVFVPSPCGTRAPDSYSPPPDSPPSGYPQCGLPAGHDGAHVVGAGPTSMQWTTP